MLHLNQVTEENNLMGQYNVKEVGFLKDSRKFLSTSDIATDFKILSIYEERLKCPMLQNRIIMAAN